MSPEQELAKEPIYNIRSVAEKTGISPETMRAWERRYGFPNPYRNPKGYRLYSSDEIAALNWLKGQTQAGMTIGQAIKLLRQLQTSGQDPIKSSAEDLKIARAGRRDPNDLRRSLQNSLLSLDEAEASKLMKIAFDQHPTELVALEIIAPILVEIGELWHEGDIPVAVEHFSSQLCRRHLIQVMESLPAQKIKGRIISACAPGEWHEIGLLILTILLQERGWGVTYLGANISLERFSEVLVRLKPQLVLFSASTTDSAEALQDMISVLEELPDPKPLVGLGGQAFLLEPTLANRLPGTFFGPQADAAVRQIDQLLSPQPAPRT